jgi:hypothetical protein
MSRYIATIGIFNSTINQMNVHVVTASIVYPSALPYNLAGGVIRSRLVYA